jgi:hypothetical protein
MEILTEAARVLPYPWGTCSSEIRDASLNGSTSISHYVNGHVFLDYSAKYWIVQFNKSCMEANGVIQSLLRICDASSNSYMTWFKTYWTGTNTDFPKNFTSLMIASYFGLRGVVKHLLELDGIDLGFLGTASSSYRLGREPRSTRRIGMVEQHYHMQLGMST